MTVERFLDQAQPKDNATVQGLVKWIANKPNAPYEGHYYRNIIITDTEDHTAPELKVTLIDSACNLIEGRAGDLVTFSGVVSQYGDKPKKLAKAKIIGDADDAMETTKNNNNNLERRIAPVVGMLYKNAFEAVVDVGSGHTDLDLAHQQACKFITRKRIQDVLDLTDKFLHPKSEAVKQAEEVFNDEDPFASE